jgi:hypothetical protein
MADVALGRTRQLSGSKNGDIGKKKFPGKIAVGIQRMVEFPVALLMAIAI